MLLAEGINLGLRNSWPKSPTTTHGFLGSVRMTLVSNRPREPHSDKGAPERQRTTEHSPSAAGRIAVAVAGMRSACSTARHAPVRRRGRVERASSGERLRLPKSAQDHGRGSGGTAIGGGQAVGDFSVYRSAEFRSARERAATVNVPIVARTIFAHGCNLGLYTMEKVAPDIAYRRLKYVSD